MSYKPYVRKEEYKDSYNGSVIPDGELERALRQASRHIDSLTFNRIVAAGFDHMTAFQKETIKEVVCMQADFEYENADEINTILSGYSINGVSAQFGSSWNISWKRYCHEAGCLFVADADGSVLQNCEVIP